MALLSAHKKIIILISVSLLILILFIYLVILPLIGKVKLLSEEYLANEKEILKLEKRDSITKELTENYEKNEKDIDKIKGAFLDPGEAIGFIYDLEKIADQTNNVFEIQAIQTPSKEIIPLEGESIVPAIGFQISLKGSYTNLLRFIANLEDTPYPPYRLIEVESFVISNIKGASQFDSGPTYGLYDIRTVINVKIYTL